MDLRIAKRENNHVYDDLWPWVLENEMTLGREDEDTVIEDAEIVEDEVSGREDFEEERERIKRRKIDPTSVIELPDRDSE